MTAETEQRLRDNLLRSDGQEDICLATYRPSTGVTRRTAIVREVIPPLEGDREVHGNASISGEYVLRAASMACERNEGVVFTHSHPGGREWQQMSGPDHDAEASFANLVREMTDLPLVGMTLAGHDGAWSARHWDKGTGSGVDVTASESVRVVGERFTVSWNDERVPVPMEQVSHSRSLTCWGADVHADLTRRSVLVVGVGSVGLDVTLRIAATGVTTIGLMDFDTIEERNLDRLIGVSATDAWLRRAKVDAARRLLVESSTAVALDLRTWEFSICEGEGLRHALDFDLIFCCVDRPWARTVLNGLAFSDLIPVIDGGIAIDAFPDGQGLRNATWRSHVIRPGRPCMSCNGQLDLGAVAAEIGGALDDPQYIAGQGNRPAESNQNVSVLSISVAASMLAQYVSFNVAPGGIGDPGPLQYLLSTNSLEKLNRRSSPWCQFEVAAGEGDARRDLTGRHIAAEAQRDDRATRRVSADVRVGRIIDDVHWAARRALMRLGRSRLRSDCKRHC